MSYLIKNCNILDVINGTILKEKDVFIENNRFKNIYPNKSILEFPRDTVIIDASGMTLMPGLIDAHIHVCWSFCHDSKELLNTPYRYAMDVKKCLEKNLLSGITTVRDAGGATLEIKEMLKNGEIAGPNVFTCGSPISQTCGHGDFLDSEILKKFCASVEPLEIVDGVNNCIKAVRRQLRKSVDWIKVFAGGGLGSPLDPPNSLQFTEHELKAIVNASHDYNKKVFAHAHYEEAIKRAIECGIDSIEHATCATRELFELAIKNNTIFVPTVNLFFIEDFGNKQEVADKMKESASKMLELAKEYFDSMLIGSGSDAFVYANHGKGAHELVRRVELGWNEMMAIKSATHINAKILGVEKEIGTIEEGYKADLLIIDGNPLDNISILTNKDALKLIMKDGKIYKNNF